jgi:hypothetical protein
MTPEEQKAIEAHSQAIAEILYRNTAAEQLTSLEKIEEAGRNAMQEHVMPGVGIFLSKVSPEKVGDTKDKSKA